MTERDEQFEPVLEQWQNVDRIAGFGLMPEDRETLLGVIEEPLRPAVGVLYDRNVQTLTSSCNVTDFAQGRAYINLYWASLSEVNQEVVKAYPHHVIGGTDNLPDFLMATLFFPINQNEDTPDVIAKRALEVAEKFHLQPFVWVPLWTIAEVRESFKHDSLDMATCSEEELVNTLAQDSFYFDAENQTFYLSEEHHRKFIQAKGL